MRIKHCPLSYPGLYVSNARAAADTFVLSHLGITHVLTVEAHRLPKRIFMGTNIKNLFIRAPNDPGTDLLPYFPISNAFIYEGLHSGNVLVHCHFGVSRSVAIVIAYLMKTYKLSYENAYRHIKHRRNYISLSPNFVCQLKEFERLNYHVNSFKKLEAYMSVYSRNSKYKAFGISTAVIVGILTPVLMIISLL